MRTPIGRYYLYSVTRSFGFYLPVGTVYLLEVRGFDGFALGMIQAVFAIGMVGAEIPTGYVGDRLGRRNSLICGKLISVVALLSYVWIETPIGYMALQFVWAIGWTMASGTSDALLYELLAREDSTDRFGAIAGRARALMLGTSAVTAALSGYLAAIDWLIPFLANALLVGIGIPVLRSLPEPGETAPASEPFTVRRAVSTLQMQLGRSAIRWFVVYAAVIYALASMTRTFEQPAALAVGVPVAQIGLLYAGFKLVSAVVAGGTDWFQHRFGIHGVFWLVLPVIAGSYLLPAVTPVAIVGVLFLSRSLRTLLTPLQNQYLNDRIGNVGRATILSGASMVFSIAASTANVGGGLLVNRLGVIDALTVAGLVATVICGLLWLTTSPVRTELPTETETH